MELTAGTLCRQSSGNNETEFVWPTSSVIMKFAAQHECDIEKSHETLDGRMVAVVHDSHGNAHSPSSSTSIRFVIILQSHAVMVLSKLRKAAASLFRAHSEEISHQREDCAAFYFTPSILSLSLSRYLCVSLPLPQQQNNGQTKVTSKVAVNAAGYACVYNAPLR